MTQKKPALTIAMSTFEDHDGVYFTIQSLRMYQDVADCEIIVLDNHPNGHHAPHVKGFIDNAQSSDCPIRYVPFAESTGTTQTRQKLFDLANGDAVLVMDCHVLLQANAIANLKKFYAEANEEDRKNLYTGPLVMDSLNSLQTHFECRWSDQMWGVWATAYHSPDGAMIVTRDNNGMTEAKVLNTDGPWVPMGIQWYGHQAVLKDKGYVTAGLDTKSAPFEVPAQGLGIFSSTKEHWLGFNEHFRHFGGEECYIHEKYRQAGRKTMCLPFLKWLHRFGRPGGPKYPITIEAKMRNYVLGFNELGKDLEEVRHHFVEEVGITPMVWDECVADPINYDAVKNLPKPRTQPQHIDHKPVSMSNLGMPLPLDISSLNGAAIFIQQQPRDLNEHAPYLSTLASECSHITEVTKRRESTLFFLAGLARIASCDKATCKKEGCSKKCKAEAKLVSFQEERDTLVEMLPDILAHSEGKGRPVTWVDSGEINLDTLPEITEETDLLFLDARHTAKRLSEELRTYTPLVRKYIVLHDTHSHGFKGEDGGDGLMVAIKAFLKENKEWYILSHTPQQYGLTVLAKDPELRPEVAIKPWPNEHGVGQQIKKALKALGLESSTTCSCNAKAAEWDAKGPDWCEENIPEILAYLKEQYVARKEYYKVTLPAKIKEMEAIENPTDQQKAELAFYQGQTTPFALSAPYTEMCVKIMVKRAIKAARKAEKEEA